MQEMSRQNAREIKNFYGTTLDECVNSLLKFQQRGESVVIDFNGHKLYSCDVTIDAAYQEVIKMTKTEYEEKRQEFIRKYEKRQAEARAKIPYWIEKGKSLIYPERMESWRKNLEARAELLDEGQLEYAINIMERLNAGESIEDITEVRDESGKVIETLVIPGNVREIVFNFSKRGPEFFESTGSPAPWIKLSDEDKKRIEDKKIENAELEELHRADSTQEVSPRQELINKYEKRQAEARAKIPYWVEKGKSLIYPERMESWRKCVEARAEALDEGQLEYAINIMERLNAGESIEDITEVRDESGKVIETLVIPGNVREIVFDFSKRGPEFFESTGSPAPWIKLSDEDKKRIEDKKIENDELEKLHRADSAQEVSLERRTAEQELTELDSKKEQLTVEIGDIEQQIEELRAKEAELKKALSTKQSELNGLEEK